MDSDDMRVAKASDRRGFTLESLDRGWIAASGVQDFDDDASPEGRLRSHKDPDSTVSGKLSLKAVRP
jgi:hypothetical protein